MPEPEALQYPLRTLRITPFLIDYNEFYTACLDTPLEQWSGDLQLLVQQRLAEDAHGDSSKWHHSLDNLPDLLAEESYLNNTEVGVGGTIDDQQRQQLENALRQLHPWRKGPFSLFDVKIDTEWRSDLKWDRLLPGLHPLQDKTVLDVGCGSGYHCWRMAGAGARMVVGIEPTLLYVYQYLATTRYLKAPVWVFPCRMEELPPSLKAFDCVFSMGILYHRRSPFEHLMELRNALRPGGQLILETLVVEGDKDTVLVPRGRYASMTNVWFIPSPDALMLWLEKLKFRDVELIDVSVTTPEEQRSTDWMTFHSLVDFLHSDSPGLTKEGYPAPKRAILSAKAP
ncbi:MAG: tRNA (mo5U34)-methyltransferase [Parasphingorhabdus sp.]|jgi:tRNA (mo5U34)-methyltransferase